MRSSSSDFGGPPGDSLPTLTEITFRPQSPHYCTFTAVVRDGRSGRRVSFSQLAQLIESIGYVGKVDDLTINALREIDVGRTASDLAVQVSHCDQTWDY